jgi:uncharacterized protein (TIGR03083 family)
VERGRSIEAVVVGAASVARITLVAPDAPVPSCPGWATMDLALHLARAHGWGAAVLRSGSREPQPSPPEGVGADERLGWAAHQSAAVVASMAEREPDADCWTFGVPRSGRFWLRRMACETAVHAWDAQHALDRASGIDAGVAAEGIDEIGEVFVPRALREPERARGWAGRAIRLAEVDGPRSWLFAVDQGGEVLDAPDAAPTLSLRAPVSDLYLWCVNRIPTERLAAEGDLSFARWWRETMRF